MMQAIGNTMGIALLLVGTAFCVIGVTGLLRMPDFYNRVQAAGLVISLGAGGIFLSLVLLAPARAGIKGVATAAFLALTAPMVTHVLARTAYRGGVRLAEESVCDELRDDLAALNAARPDSAERGDARHDA